MTRTSEITFDDLNRETQQRFLEFQGLDRPQDGNFDLFPIAVIEIEGNNDESDNNTV